MPDATEASAGGGRLAFEARFETASDFFDRFDRQINSPDFEVTNPGEVAEWHGDHDMACAGPDTGRTIQQNTDGMFWWCAPGDDAAKGHIMTSTNSVGVFPAMFSPRQSFDSVTKVCWDQNGTAMGGRKWTNMILVPEATFQANERRLDYTVAGFNTVGGPGTGLLQNQPIFGVKGAEMPWWFSRDEQQLVRFGDQFNLGTDKATRLKICAERLSDASGTDQANIRITHFRPDGPSELTGVGTWPGGPMRVIFQDANYDAGGAQVPDTFTWHWDNIEIYTA